jgi:hypothetical protein
MLTIEAVLAFPELGDDGGQGTDAVPELFHRMAADDQGTLKCRIVLEARWEADGTVDGNLSQDLWAVSTRDESYGEDQRTVLPGAERARIQAVYVPASRDGARQLTAFLRGRLWRAVQWSGELRELVAASAARVSGQFHDEAATSTVEKALSLRWQELHGAGTHSVPRFQPIAPCPGGEKRMLQLPASLIGHALVILGDSSTGLDDRNVRILAGLRRFPHLHDHEEEGLRLPGTVPSALPAEPAVSR